MEETTDRAETSSITNTGHQLSSFFSQTVLSFYFYPLLYNLLTLRAMATLCRVAEVGGVVDIAVSQLQHVLADSKGIVVLAEPEHLV